MNNNAAHKLAITAVVNEILKKIEEAAKEGKFYLHFKLTGDRHYAQKAIRMELEVLGFSVTNPSDEYTTLMINWANRNIDAR